MFCGFYTQVREDMLALFSVLKMLVSDRHWHSVEWDYVSDGTLSTNAYWHAIVLLIALPRGFSQEISMC